MHVLVVSSRLVQVSVGGLVVVQALRPAIEKVLFFGKGSETGRLAT